MRSNVKALAVASVLVLIPSVLGAQSLGEAARKAREQREAKAKAEAEGEPGKTAEKPAPKAPARTYTEEDLAALPPVQSSVGESGSTGSDQPRQGAPISTLESPPPAPQDDAAKTRQQAAWRKRMQDAERGVALRKETLLRLEGSRRGTLTTTTELENEIAKARDDLRDAEKRIVDITDEARRAGVPPGWLR